MSEQAIPYWQRAGQRTNQRSAYEEAISRLTKGLGLFAMLPNTTERAQQELVLQTLLGTVFMAAKGYAAPEVEKTFTRAHDLCRQIGDSSQLFPVLWWRWAFYLDRAEHQMARQLGEELLTIAHRQYDSTLEGG